MKPRVRSIIVACCGVVWYAAFFGSLWWSLRHVGDTGVGQKRTGGVGSPGYPLLVPPALMVLQPFVTRFLYKVGGVRYDAGAPPTHRIVMHVVDAVSVLALVAMGVMVYNYLYRLR